MLSGEVAALAAARQALAPRCYQRTSLMFRLCRLRVPSFCREGSCLMDGETISIPTRVGIVGKLCDVNALNASRTDLCIQIQSFVTFLPNLLGRPIRVNDGYRDRCDDLLVSEQTSPGRTS